MLGHDPAPMLLRLYSAHLLIRGSSSALAKLPGVSNWLDKMSAEAAEYVHTAVLLAALSTCKHGYTSGVPVDMSESVRAANPRSMPTV